MKKSIKTVIVSLLVIPMLAVGLFTALTPMASAANIKDGANLGKVDGQANSLFGADGVFTDITNAALFIIGALSVLMLIYGGIRYTISGGDQAAVTSAKNTILYAIVGIIVAVMAFAIVNYVLGTVN